jgi:hypothetical protein
MVSLGKLAAGLAHELNNPASAATRSADELARSVRDLETAAVALGAAGLPPAGFDAIARLRRTHLASPARHSRAPMEQADWEDAIEDWLDQHDLPDSACEALADSSVTLDSLDQLAAELTPGQLATVLSWFGAGQSARQLASDIEIATGRIYSLVAAVKGFTYMDQSTAPSRWTSSGGSRTRSRCCAPRPMPSRSRCDWRSSRTSRRSSVSVAS